MKHPGNSLPVEALPWHRQFWPWFLLSIPVITVIACTATLLLAVNTGDSLTVDNYYQQGLAINRDRRVQQQTLQRGITAHIKVSNRGVIDATLQGAPHTQRGLKLQLVHTTLARHDQTVPLHPVSHNRYRGMLGKPTIGRYHLTLQPATPGTQDDHWVLPGHHIAVPTQTRFQLGNPKNGHR